MCRCQLQSSEFCFIYSPSLSDGAFHTQGSSFPLSVITLMLTFLGKASRTHEHTKSVLTDFAGVSQSMPLKSTLTIREPLYPIQLRYWSNLKYNVGCRNRDMIYSRCNSYKAKKDLLHQDNNKLWCGKLIQFWGFICIWLGSEAVVHEIENVCNRALRW